MDFNELLSVAKVNKTEAKSEASVKRYSTVLAPPKKLPKSGVQTDGIQRFLAKKKAEEQRLAEEAERKKAKLLALRAQNTKNSKKAKIMASRTKDNDFSKIKLTEDELEAKRQREELLKKNLSNKVERMKARIALEEKEALLPRKRKRKSKNKETEVLDEINMNESCNDNKELQSNSIPEIKKIHKPKPKPTVPQLSFHDLLKVAEVKQHEPLDIITKKKEEPKLMTKKEKMLALQEEERLRRKQERIAKGLNPYSVSQNDPSLASDKLSQKTISAKSNKPYVIHVEKDVNSRQQTGTIKATNKSQNNININKKVPNQATSKPINSLRETKEQLKLSKSSSSIPNNLKPSMNNLNAIPKKEIRNNIKSLPQKNSVNNSLSSSSKMSLQTIDTDALVADLEKKIREKIEREMEEKIAAKFGLKPRTTQVTNNSDNKNVLKDQSKLVKDKIIQNRNNVPAKSEKLKSGNINKNFSERNHVPKSNPERKPAFHPNPYLDPPRRLLEPQLKKKPPNKKRLESDEDEDDDDMSDFIDNGPSQNDEDYSRYIKEIFGYDRNRYQDEDDDDDIIESSFAQQMKEEVFSAKAGYLEDLEEERKEREELRKKKKKLK